MTSKVSEMLSACVQSVTSIAKLVLQSRPASITKAKAEPERPLIILGNGPSLKQTIAESLPALQSNPTMAVNFFANTPAFEQIKPQYYILIDPLFFAENKQENFAQLDDNIAAVTWLMTLIVPVKYGKKVSPKIAANPNIKVVTVNALAVEGWRWLTTAAYSRGWGMPRPRNVLVPAIMAGVQMGYKEIYVTGADHSWLSTISVNERNEVVSIQPHFYKDDEKEVKRQRTDYLHYPLHQIIHSFYVAFKSYHDIRRYADRRGISVYNSTPGSFIDAFERRPLP